jgi:ABC-type lipoprotein export system ATPase subunit
MLEAREIFRSYQIERSTVEVLRGVSLTVAAGESVSIVGQSGAGKSTLLHCLGGLDRPTSGTLLYKGEDLYSAPASRRDEIRALQVGFVFQAYHLLPELDVLENVQLPAFSQHGALRHRKVTDELANDLLNLVGLGHRAHHRPYELSGGEQQRVAIARALMNGPELVLADEPTGNLDSRTGGQVLDYLFDLVSARGHTLVLVTHNEGVADLCRRKVLLQDGRIASA